MKLSDLPKILLPVFILSFGIILWMERSEATESAMARERLLTVETVRVQTAEFYTSSRNYLGRVEADQISQLGFELAGTLEKLPFEEGDSVSKGQIMAELNTNRLEAQRKQLLALRSERRASQRLAERTFKRTKNLFEQKSVSAQQLDETEQQVEAAKALIESVQAQIAQLDIELAKSVLKAPFDGVITQQFQDIGAVVGVGMPLFNLLSEGKMTLRVRIDSETTVNLKPGRVLEVDGVKVELRRILPQIHPQLRTRDVLFSIPTQTSDWVDGQIVEFPIETSHNEKGIWIPRSALVESQRGLWGCYVAVPTKTADEFLLERRQLAILAHQGDRVYVQGALQDGEQVVVSGLHKLTPGLRVRRAADS